MATWSKSALSLAPVVSESSFPTLAKPSVPTGPPSKRPATLSMADKLKKAIETEKAELAMKKPAPSKDEAHTSRMIDAVTQQQISLIHSLYAHKEQRRRFSDEDYLDEYNGNMADYESALEYHEHLRYNRKEKQKVADYSKDLSDEDYVEDEHHDDSV